MKAVWICHFSNSNVRELIQFQSNSCELFVYKVLNKTQRESADYAMWITNAIRELEGCSEIELHVISPHYGMRHLTQEFSMSGINYHFFRPDENFFLIRGFRYIFKTAFRKHRGNRRIIQKFIRKIQPDIIHMYGAENIYYSLSALDIDLSQYPFLISLQTLVNDPVFKMKYPMDKAVYKIISEQEYRILNRVKFIGSSVPKYRELVWDKINPQAIFTKTFLAVSQVIEVLNIPKEFDFVYFAASINKAAGDAVESFAIANRKYPDLTLNIIGKSNNSFMKKLRIRIAELRISDVVIFSDFFPSHNDLLIQIQKSKYALLPLKSDSISGTIREAMFAGIPVLSTITDGTPDLNIDRESILLAEQEDYLSMALNMIKLIESPEYSEKLKRNALITAHGRWNNRETVQELLHAYKAIIDYYRTSKPISTEIASYKS